MLGYVDRTPQNFAKSVKGALIRRYGDDLSNSCITSEFATHNFTNIFEGKKLLVVGGGPTTNSVDWDPSIYDHIISCHHFFLHPKLSKINVSLAAISPEVDIRREEFTSYYDSFNTIFMINNHDTKDSVINTLRDRDAKRLAIMEQRVRFKIGQGPHLLILATLFNPLSIDFFGIDGYPPDTKVGDSACHAFEKGKIATGTKHKYEVYLEQFRQLWGYLFNVGKHITYRNLGYGHNYNISSQFISEYIPHR